MPGLGVFSIGVNFFFGGRKWGISGGPFDVFAGILLMIPVGLWGWEKYVFAKKIFGFIFCNYIASFLKVGRVTSNRVRELANRTFGYIAQ